jgi:hypothetical protein
MRELRKQGIKTTKKEGRGDLTEICPIPFSTARSPTRVVPIRKHVATIYDSARAFPSHAEGVLVATSARSESAFNCVGLQFLDIIVA